APPPPVATDAPAPGPSTAVGEPAGSATTAEAPAPVETSAPAAPAPPSTTVAEAVGAAGCTATVTLSSEIAPTNCLGSGQVWGLPAGKPDYCDGANPKC
ncbi:hypothetical protein K505DRAFT_368324, partial [Melanomma pulvis-pyrius CBS 109.77]